VTRYGNVSGSQGSVIPKWRELIEAGHTFLPVTDPDCTRFYMTMDEAVALVWTLLVSMTGGEIAIPDWLPAYRLGDLAEAFDAKPEIIGLPNWEKLHESMNGELCSATARRMSVDELRRVISYV
jgi:FlaA1/EpsC-like NDP-sugar epimerase